MSAFCLLVMGVVVSGCVGSDSARNSKSKTVVTSSEHINNETKFSSKEFGVKGSPRVTAAKRTRKGGGRFQIGKPYKIRGKWYKPKEDPNLKEVGLASWYGPNFHGRLTANGEIYDQYGISAAHPTMPLPSYASVTNLENGRKITVRVNDRGPFSRNRVIDLSAKAAELLGYTKQGVAKVKVEYVGRARMDGLDEDMLLASYVGPGAPSFDIGNSSGTMIALAEPLATPSAESAIDGNFDLASGLGNGQVPVPIARPTLFEGVPLAGSVDGGAVDNALASAIERVVYKPVESPQPGVLDRVPRPLAYADDPSELAKLAFSYTAYPDGFKNPYGDESVQIEIGNMDGSSMDLLRALLRDAGSLRHDIQSGMTVLTTDETRANQVLVYLREIGLVSSRIL